MVHRLLLARHEKIVTANLAQIVQHLLIDNTSSLSCSFFKQCDDRLQLRNNTFHSLMHRLWQEHWFMTPNSKILVKMLTVMTNDLMPKFKILPDAPRRRGLAVKILYKISPRRVH